MIKALIFDYNQVLVNDLEAHVVAYKNTFKKYGAIIPDTDLLSTMYKSHAEKVKILAEKFGLQKLEKKLFGEKEKEFQKAAKGKNFLFPETKEIIALLAKKFLLTIVTGTTRKQIMLPKALLKQFKAIVSDENVKEVKPNPASLLYCIKLLKVKPAECAYIGDAPTDMQAAKNAGVFAIGITTGTFSAKKLREAGADTVIKGLKELLRLKL